MRLTIRYGPADGKTETPRGSIAMLGLTAPKNGIASSARNVGFARTSLITSVWPFAVTPVTERALFWLRASAPTTSCRNAIAGDACCGSAARSIARLNAAAVTGEPSLNLSPLRTVNVYVLPSRDTRGKPVAASGTSRVPSGAGLSG